MLVTLGGDSPFGLVLECRHAPRATAQQVNAFFGVTGQQAVFGGGRGRSFAVKGLLIAGDIAGIRAMEDAIETYADGVPRTLDVGHADGSATSYENVIFMGEYQPQGDPRPNIETGSYVQAYTLTLHGLT